MYWMIVNFLATLGNCCGRFVDLAWLSKARSGKSRVSKILYVHANKSKAEAFRSAPNIEIRAFSNRIHFTL